MKSKPQERRYSAAELAAHSGIPLPTVKYFVKEGILTPSLWRASGSGQGHVFNTADVLAAMSLKALLLPNAHASPLRHLMSFWHTPAGQALVAELSVKSTEPEPCIVTVTEKGVTIGFSPAMIPRKKGETGVAFCVDLRALVTRLYTSTRASVAREPGASGRTPWGKK